MIFFTSTSLSTFVKKDLQILQELDSVFYFNFEPSSKIFTPLVFVRQGFAILFRLHRIRLFVCMFAAYHSFLPAIFARLFGIPLLVMVGGVEAVSYPSFRYGYFQHRLIRPFVRWTFKMSTAIAAKDESLFFFEDHYYGKDSPGQGINYFLPGLKALQKAIYNGYDAHAWHYDGEKRSDHFITVAGGWQYGPTVMLKGIDLILSIAPDFPECTFEIVGVSEGVSLGNLPDNVMLTGYIPNDKLAGHIGAAEFYLQLSITEGFPNALCEAMLCRCIPIVSEVAAMPKIVGDTGFILKKRDEQQLVQLIQKALELEKDEREHLGMQARARIIEHFPLERRAKALKDLVCKICPVYAAD